MSFQIHTLGFFFVCFAKLEVNLKMKTKLMLALILVSLFIPKQVFAQEKASQASATIQNLVIKTKKDYRAKILFDYLMSQDSPLAAYSQDFIYYADKYNLDWRLVPAITGVESSFGKAIPPYSYNGWGWGVYGDNVIRFKSWTEGIATVSKGLREKYINQWGGKDIYKIGSMYASSPYWASHVNFYINKINEFALNNPQDTLPLSL
jgi:hypothetical protein